MIPLGAPMARATIPIRLPEPFGAVSAACASAWNARAINASPVRHGNALAEGLVHGGTSAARVRIVKTRKVVMDQGAAMQQLDRRRRRGRQPRVVLGAGAGHRDAQPWPDPRAAGNTA